MLASHIVRYRLQVPSQPRQAAHLAKLADLRGNVEEHFKLNERFGEEIFTVDDIRYTHDLFNLFCTADGVLLDLKSDDTPLVQQMKVCNTSCAESCEHAMHRRILIGDRFPVASTCARTQLSWCNMSVVCRPSFTADTVKLSTRKRKPLRTQLSDSVNSCRSSHGS